MSYLISMTDEAILVDARGHRCPMPTLKLRKALEAAPEGALVKLLADDPLAIVHDAHDGRRGARALRVLDHLRRLAVHDRDAAIGGAEVDTDDFRHGALKLLHGGRTHGLLQKRRAGPVPNFGPKLKAGRRSGRTKHSPVRLENSEPRFGRIW